MIKTSLCGAWQYRVGFGAWTSVTVPFSRLPVGRSECVRRFDLPHRADRLFLKFDGITYFAEISLNGTSLGEMLPYCEYEFEITDLVKDRDNELCVVLEDINRAFGPSEGWENFGGIIRDVWLIEREQSYLKNVFFHCEFQNDYKDAVMQVEIDADCPHDAAVRIELSHQGKLICSYLQPIGECTKTTVQNIRLWSPDTPVLYALKTTLLIDGAATDEQICEVGFRHLSHDRHRIYLNGSPLFLKGICKHEMVNDSGHCPTPAQMEADLRLIKEMGCNFVRLVHYPHNKKILELADRIGLLVSEEPGLWWSDTSNEEIAEGSYEVLRRTILRDRNHPSIAFWLCFNECQFTEQFLIKSAEICRRYDPTRMVSGANCMSNEDTLLYYNKCGFDFYTMHPYSDTFAKAQKSAEMLSDKPLIFTEWGGYFVYDNPHLLLDFMQKMHNLYQNNADSGALAGAFLWFFAELNDYNRGTPACIDGRLREGVVTMDRKPTLIFDAFCQGLKLFDATEKPAFPFQIEPAEAYDTFDGQTSLACESTVCEEQLLSIMQAEAQTKGNKRKRKIEKAPVLPSKPTYLLTSDTPLIFKGCESATALSILGLTALVGGYPFGGGYGDVLATMQIRYKSGKTQVLELKNGVHITTVYATSGSSRINPIAEEAKRFALFGYDKNFEYYLINRLDVKVDGEEIDRVVFSSDRNDCQILLYGVIAT